MIETRDYESSDADAILELHRKMGMDYKMPNIDGPLFIAKEVIVQDGIVVGCAGLKLQAETYLWLDPEMHPEDKWTAIRLAHKQILRKAFAIGLEQLVSYLPTMMEKVFGKRLKALGWDRGRDGWHPWSREVTK